LMAASAWPEAVELLGDDRVWPYLLVADELLVERLAAEGLVPRALAAGRDAALQVRRDYPAAQANEVLAGIGVPVVYSSEESPVSWRYPRSSYQQDPPQVQVYVCAIPMLGELAQAVGLGGEFSEGRLTDLMLAHELYHHLALTHLGRVSAQHRLWKRLLGPLGRWVEVPVLDEVAAHAFVREFCRLRISPAVLDLLTVHRAPERFGALVRRARVLRNGIIE